MLSLYTAYHWKVSATTSDSGPGSVPGDKESRKTQLELGRVKSAGLNPFEVVSSGSLPGR
jgi:hypothetical protein